MRGIWVAGALIALALTGAAHAQNLALRAPDWAQPLLATDVTPTTGGRAALYEDGVDVAARLTIIPNQGGVARVIRYEQRGDSALLALRRFTGHNTTGWWMWGPDTPYVTTPAAAVRQELATLVRAAGGVAVSGGGDLDASCPSGERYFLEMAIGGRATSVTRACVNANEPAGRLAARLSMLAGSRTEEELHESAIAEVMEADRAFARMAQSDGVAAAFAAFADQNAIMFNNEGNPIQGHDAVVARYANWPAGARLEWAPETGRVSARGDMGWTWGRATYTAPDGARHPGRYVSIWTRDIDGKWKFAFDASLQ